MKKFVKLALAAALMSGLAAAQAYESYTFTEQTGTYVAGNQYYPSAGGLENFSYGTTTVAGGAAYLAGGGSTDLQLLFSGLAADSEYTLSFDTSGTGMAAVDLRYDIDVNTGAFWSAPSGALALYGASASAGSASILGGEVLNYATGGSFAHDTVSFRTGAAGDYYATFKNVSSSVLTLDNVTLTAGAAATAVPEPESYAMLMAGLGALGFMARRRKA